MPILIMELIRTPYKSRCSCMVVSHVSFFTPRAIPDPASPTVSMMSGTTAVRVLFEGLQLMSHFNRTKIKPKLISRLFLSISSERKDERGIFLKSGGKRPVGWV
ncbi:hypothetical protein EMIT0P291_300030 [Pseudomonas sp. IT-P291]